MPGPNSNFKDCVYAIVALIPEGKVMTYGQIAAMCGRPRAARVVGGIAHQARCVSLPACGPRSQSAGSPAYRTDFVSADSLHRSMHTAPSAAQQEPAHYTGRSAPGLCPLHDLPWQRVVKKDGSLAEGYPGGTAGHYQVLSADGVEIHDYRVNMKKHLWVN